MGISMKRAKPIRDLNPGEEELWQTPENSLFKTRIPRPSHVLTHLILAFVMFLLSLIIAILFQDG